MASVSVGGGKSSGSSQTSSPAADTLANLANAFAAETRTARKDLIGMMEEVMQTGGSTLPIISAGVERSRQAGSQARQQTAEQLALSDLAGTPFGEKIRADQTLATELAARGVETDFAAQILNMIPNFILGQSQTATSGLAGAIPGQKSETASGKSSGAGITGGK